MADPDLVKTLGAFSSWSFWQKIQDEATSLLASAIGRALTSYWNNSKLIIILLILIFFIKKYEERGIGSVVYNLFFLSLLGIIISIFSWEILFNSYFEIIYLLIYIFSYKLTRILLRKIGIWK